MKTKQPAQHHDSGYFQSVDDRVAWVVVVGGVAAVIALVGVVVWAFMRA